MSDDSILDEFEDPPHNYRRKKLRKLVKSSRATVLAAADRIRTRPRWQRDLIRDLAAKTNRARNKPKEGASE